jgi:hypothetical protein
MNGCTRQKYVYVPGRSFFGVRQTTVFVAAVAPAGP